MGNLSVICRYPQRVVTNIRDQVNKEAGPFFSRVLQEDYEIEKVVENQQASVRLARYKPVDNEGTIDGLRTTFQVISRIVIYAGFLLFFLGLQTISTYLKHNLQKIWLHIFLAALAAPSLLRHTLSGFRQTQNQNIAINPSQW